MPIQLSVREATAQDVQAIHSITQEAFSKYAHDLGQPRKVKALDEDTAAIERELGQKHILIGELDGVPQGSIRYEVVSGIAYFTRFGVRLAAQSCGLGRRLVQAVIERAREQGCTAVALHTSARMASLIRFYYGQGFFIHSISTNRGYYRALLIKELSPRDDCVDYAPLLGDR